MQVSTNAAELSETSVGTPVLFPLTPKSSRGIDWGITPKSHWLLASQTSAYPADSGVASPPFANKPPGIWRFFFCAAKLAMISPKRDEPPREIMHQV